MMSSVRDRVVARRPSSAAPAPAGRGSVVVSQDEKRAYATPVSGDGVFVPEGDIIAPPDTTSGRSGAPGEPAAPPVSPGRANATLVALGVAAFLMVTNEVAPLGLIKTMATDLGRSEEQLGMTATVFAIATMIATLPLAMLTTRMVRRWVIVGTLLFWSVGALVAGVTESYEGLLASRVLTGMGHALFWAVVTPAAAGMFPAAQRGRSVARLLLGASGAGVIGLPAETFLAQRIGWHAPFVILAIGGTLMAITVALLMPSFRTQQSTLPRGDVPSMSRFIRIMFITALTTWAMSLSWTFYGTLFTEVTGFADSVVPVLLFVGGVVGVAATWMVARYVDRWPVKSVAVGQVLLLFMWIGLSLGIHSKGVAVAMICLQALAWSVIVVAMVNWALRHTPWTSDLGNGTYAAVFNLGNAVGSRLGAVILGVWGARWLPVWSMALTSAALVLILTVGGLTSRDGAVRRVVADALGKGSRR